MSRRSIDEFELGRVIGVGTVGTIYEAFDKTSESEVALKCLLPTVSSDAVIQARFAREMVILEKLSHPNIVQYYGGGRDGDQLFFAMELAKGGSLKSAIEQNGAFSWAEAVTCGVQICSALQYAHNHGILHRDLKPSNLLFDEEGNLKLVDFGIARDTHEADLTSRGLTVGSYTYMSPEQICGDESITGQTDLYSLGAVMFEMLTGRPPFVGNNFGQLFRQHLSQPPPTIIDRAPETPPELERIVLELLAKKPEDRPFNARAVQGVLLSLMNHRLSRSETADVSASEAMELGKRAVARRLRPEPRDVSWTTLGGVSVVIAAIAWAAWLMNR